MNGSEGERGTREERKIWPVGDTKENGKCGDTTAVPAVFWSNCGECAKTAALLSGKVATCDVLIPVAAVDIGAPEPVVVVGVAEVGRPR